MANNRTEKERVIVSSRHPDAPESWPLSELEYGLIVAFNAFSRWMVRCAKAAGVSDLSPTDVLILHNINHRGTDKTLADIAFMLNIEDIHTVNYAAKKLLKRGFVAGTKRGKEVFYSTTIAGKKLCKGYWAVREQCLLGSIGAADQDPDEILSIAARLRTLSGLYDQAARSATSL